VRRPIVIVGAGAFGREVHDVIEAVNEVDGDEGWDFLGFLDDNVENPDLLVGRGPVLGGTSNLDSLPGGTRYVIAIGSGRVRRQIDENATTLGLEPAVLVHPAATMGRHGIHIGPGTIICSHVSLTTDIRLGRHVHLNLNVTVGHDAILEDYATVNPGATISGHVVLETEVMIGTNAAVIQGKTVGARSIVGAGASVVRSVPPSVVVVGVPAKALGPVT
jgi:sugar O-acyltransferase (sialic acid O-acetyltransferase NeuD family)